MFERASGTFWHYDSASPSNRHVAQAVFSAVQGFCCPAPTADASARSNIAASSTAPPCLVEVCGMPRQRNGYDCGVYVLATASHVCSCWTGGVGAGKTPSTPSQAAGLSGVRGRLKDVEPGLSCLMKPCDITAFRAHVLQVIEELLTLGAHQPRGNR